MVRSLREIAIAFRSVMNSMALILPAHLMLGSYFMFTAS